MLVFSGYRLRYVLISSAFRRGMNSAARLQSPKIYAAIDDGDDDRRVFDEEDRIRQEPEPIETKDLKVDSTTSKKSPKEVVAELDRFIIGQEQAKKAVAIALRNRWRRHRLPSSIKDEVVPKNILMVGPTGCGKTEVARRLAKLTNAPFIKVEATKFTEVGFHGRDVDTIIRDLVRISIQMLRQRKRVEGKKKVQATIEEQILDALMGKQAKEDRETFRGHLRSGQLDETHIDVEVPVKDTAADFPSLPGFITIGPKTRKMEKKRLKVKEYRPILEQIEMDRLTSGEELQKEAIKIAEEDGIVVIDEIDKIVSNREYGHRNADASAEGVQRDLLPLIEGTIINTKFGNVDTTHILFIASGAFHSCKPSDMLAELQGRLPIRVELKALTEDDLYRVLTCAENNLIQQQIALIATENVKLHFTDTAIRKIAKVSAELNRSTENIGARRLHTVIERIVTDVSFRAPELTGAEFTIDEEYVDKVVVDFLRVTDLKRFIL